jgi:hypothetical protein
LVGWRHRCPRAGSVIFQTNATLNFKQKQLLSNSTAQRSELTNTNRSAARRKLQSDDHVLPHRHRHAAVVLFPVVIPAAISACHAMAAWQRSFYGSAGATA